MMFNIFNSLMLVGAIQGIVFALLVASSKKYKTKSTMFLVLLIFCFALNNIQYYIYDTEVLNEYDFFRTIYIPLAILCPVFYYLYVKTFLSDQKISISEKLLFLPFCLFLIVCLYYKSLILFGSNPILAFEDLIEVEIIQEIAASIFSLLLLTKSYLMILNFKDQQLNFQMQKSSLDWLKITTVILIVLCLIWAYAIYDDLQQKNSTAFYLVWISLSFTIYWLGHIGIYKYGIRNEQQNLRKFSKTNAIVVSVPSESEHILGFKNFIIDQKNYLNSELTLDLVAENLNISKTYLSKMINKELKMGYSDFINSLRVEEAKMYMKNSEFENYTLVAIGLEAGFNSKSAFNNAFKKHTGLTPSEFKKSVDA